MITTLNTSDLIISCSDILESLVCDWIKELDVGIKSKRVYSEQIDTWIKWLGIRDVRLLSHADILEYKTYLVQQSLSVHTINAYLSCVKRFFDYLDARGVLRNITKRVKNLPTPKGFSKDILTVHQIRDALDTFDISTLEGCRDYAIFNLIVRTGLRTCEVSRSLVGDIRQDSGESVLYVQGKGRSSKDAFVLLLHESLKPIRRYLSMRGISGPNDALFASESNRTKGKCLNERTISWIVKETLRRINIDDTRLTAHSLRHTAVSLSIRGGASLVQAQAMARHADPKTTMIYFHNIDRVSKGAERHIII